MVAIIPTVFSHNKREFVKRLNHLIPHTKYLQIDFMDGRFVKSKSVKLDDVPNLKKHNKFFEAHLMVNSPQSYLNELKRKGFCKIIFHYEALGNDHEVMGLVARIKSLGLKVFLGVNPETSVKKIKPHLRMLDGVLLMGVHPGREHQKLLASTYKRVREIKKLNPKIKVQVDGGVNLKNIKRLVDAGVDIVNSGSLVAESDNPKGMILELKSSHSPQ